MSKKRVSIIGGAGYGSAELLRHLIIRDDVELLRVSSKDYVGQTIGQVHRSLYGYSDIKLEDISPLECVEGADFVFLAMPHVTTARVAMELFSSPVRIIDLSGDFRLKKLADYQADYAPEHPCPEQLGQFVYGLPELNADAIKNANRVASPGCFATGINLGLLPLANEGLLVKQNIRTVAMTGSSGSGVKPQAGTHHPVRSRNIKAYKILHHQHRSEIVQTLEGAGASEVSLDFVPVSAPLSRGILAISQLDLPTGHDFSSLLKLYQDYYQDFHLIKVLPKGMTPEVAAVANTASAEIGLEVRIDPITKKATLCCISAIDNLIKGGAGQAIQSFNLMMEKPVNFGLDKPGLWP